MRFISLICFLLVVKLSAQTGQVFVQSVNSETVGQYEKFEIIVTLENVNFSNPYNPDDVDLRAIFTSPSGKEWEIFGFYDNYQNANKWKVRFSANESGTWTYYLSLNSTNGSAQSENHSFNVTESDHHGWIRVSPVNRHYFIYDDGTPFYGVGPYYPWSVNNSSTGLAQLEASGCNFWGYWNIMYDVGEIIESVNSGLGRYDQYKCGWIDQLIGWSEDRDLKMMLSIWPHDLFCNSLSGWAKQWANNPYNTICDVNDIYENEVAWQYQKKQYRYIIARWGYSRALGVWEIINEINGTDAWVAGKLREAQQWTVKVHNFLNENDPHERPTTASKSGGEYWPEGYAAVDISNVHMYETGWLSNFPANPLRSSAYTYHNVANQLFSGFDKPAIFGEAGATNSYGDFAAGTEEYTAMFHNGLWAGWAGGLAVTPVWWSFTSKQVMTADVMEQMHTFSEITRDYNYAYQNFAPYSMQAGDSDVYAMRSDTSIFGWIREAHGKSVKNKILQFKALRDTSYEVSWYNTWTGEKISRDFIVGVDTLVTISVPESIGDYPDAAFFLEETAEGSVPARLRMGSASRKIYVRRNEVADILCTVHDVEGRFVRSAENMIKFEISGPGHLTGPDQITAESGMVSIGFTADSTSGLAEIIASSTGLISDTLIIEVANRIWLDDFEGYSDISDLDYFWFERAGTYALMSIANSITGSAGSALQVDYSIGDGSAPYAGFYCHNVENLKSVEALDFWFKGDGSGRTLAILVNEKNGRYWQFDYPISNTDPEFLSVPLDAFTASDTASIMHLDEIDEISFNILKGNGEFGTGVIILDDINFFIPAIETAVEDERKTKNPAKFKLMQNYPNPFNNSTTIRYILPKAGKTTIEIFDTTGRIVEKVLDGVPENAGGHSIQWKNKRLASGLYFYRVRSGQFEAIRKCILIK